MRIVGLAVALTITGACVVGALYFAMATKNELENLFS